MYDMHLSSRVDSTFFLASINNVEVVETNTSFLADQNKY